MLLSRLGHVSSNHEALSEVTGIRYSIPNASHQNIRTNTVGASSWGPSVVVPSIAHRTRRNRFFRTAFTQAAQFPNSVDRETTVENFGITNPYRRIQYAKIDSKGVTDAHRYVLLAAIDLAFLPVVFEQIDRVDCVFSVSVVFHDVVVKFDAETGAVGNDNFTVSYLDGVD